MEDQLTLGRGAARVVHHDAVVVCVHADVGVLGVDSWRATGHPERLDLLVLEDIVEVHIFAENVLHGASVVCLKMEVS